MADFSSSGSLRVSWDNLPARGLEGSDVRSGCFPAGVAPLGPDEWFWTSQSGIGGGVDITPGRLTAGELAAGAHGKGR